ncbi:MAG: hypothetical protein WBP84_11600 [Nitrososphaeraceae archaeon]
MPLLVWGEILDCVDDKLCHGTKTYNIMIGDNLKHNEGTRWSGSKGSEGKVMII